MSKHTPGPTPMSEQRGDAPIVEEQRDLMNELAVRLDVLFNGEAKGTDRKNGFILMVFPFETDDGRCNYISNAERKDVVAMLKHQIARFEGQPDLKGSA